MLKLSSRTDRIQGWLLGLAGFFLLVYSTALTLSPAARARTWSVALRWDHWLAFGLWVLAFALSHWASARWMPERDPYLIPLAGLLSGWGLLTIWRLSPAFGIRQSIWLLFSLLVFVIFMRLPEDLGFLRRYKYLWLTGGLLLTGMTLLLGTNPSGGNLPRLWLGCCGIYFQPSEPLKLLLIIYLSAYLADRFLINSPGSSGLLPILAPTLIMTGLALLLLLVQRDLGTASIFLFLYAVTIYIASGRRLFLLASSLAVILAAVAGYVLFDVVRLRMDAWLNPWLDPSGRSYQIVQSLLAIANGGLLGRGPGMGNPGLVPVPQSDFIFAAIAEEGGLMGASALILLLGLLAVRGLRAALGAPDAYRRYLAAGLTAFIVGQSVLIIGGNLRLFPLTGVTLPLVSYGGSSLLTSYLSLALLLHISSRAEERPAFLPDARPYFQLGVLLLLMLAAAALLAGWWAVYRSPDLLTRTDNPRRAIADRYVKRGSLLDRHDLPLAASEGKPGNYNRHSFYPPLGPVIGYTNPIYGQSGLEASLDPYLRGLQGNPALLIWWNNLLYGTPPAGLDVRLTLDLNIQRVADQSFGDHAGALVLLNARSGDILAMASHPSFDANELDRDFPALIRDPHIPLFNRAAMGQYQPGTALGPLLLAGASIQTRQIDLPTPYSYRLGELDLDCIIPPVDRSWGAAAGAGCPAPLAAITKAQDQTRLLSLFQELGLYSSPEIRLPAASSPLPKSLGDPVQAALGQSDLRLSPLQMALAAATLSNDGIRPAPRLAFAVDIPGSGWVILPELGEPYRVFAPGVTAEVARSLSIQDLPAWQSLANAVNGPEKRLTWYLAGTLPDWKGDPLAISILLEENNPQLAMKIGQQVLKAAIQP